MQNKSFTEMTAGEFVKDYWRGIICVSGIAVVALFLIHLHGIKTRKQADEEAFYQSEETFELPAKSGAASSYSEVEKPIWEHCQLLYQNVDVVSVNLKCEAFENHDETPAMDPRGSYGTERRVIEEWNAANAGRYVKSIDVGWKIVATVTHRRKRDEGGKSPLVLKWLCPAPNVGTEWPHDEGLFGVELARQNYGIAFTNVSSHTMFSQGYQGSGRGYLVKSKEPFEVNVEGNPAKDPTTGPSVKLSTSASNVGALFEDWASNCWRSAISAYKPCDFEMIVGDVTFHPERMKLDYSMTRAHTTATIERLIEPTKMVSSAVGDSILLWGRVADDLRNQNGTRFRVSGTFYDHPDRNIYFIRRFEAVSQ